jgi:hypothetical protein
VNIFPQRHSNFQPGPPDAITELIVGAIAAAYPGAVLQEAILHDSGRVTSYFVDEDLSKTFQFEINNGGFSFKSRES